MSLRHGPAARLAVLLAIAFLSVSLALSFAPAPAPAFAGAWWRLSARAAPTLLPPGGKATLILTASNVGAGRVNATSTPVRITDSLPADLEAIAIKGAPAFEFIEEGHQMKCDLKTVSCVSEAEVFPSFQALDVTIEVNVKPDASGAQENKLSVQGGEQEGTPGVEVPGQSIAVPVSFSAGATPFGIEPDGYQLSPEEEGGALDVRAGSHPFQLTTTLNLNQTTETVAGLGVVPAAPALAKQLSFNLPPGLIGDPLALPACPAVDFLAITNGDTNECQAHSAIGVVVVTLNEPAQFHYVTRMVPLWNLEPAKGEPARLGFEVLKVPIVLDTSVRSGGDYGVSVSVDDAPQAAQILSSEVTIWGVPGEASHDFARGWACILEGVYVNHEVPCTPPDPRPTSAFLTLPSACTGALSSTVEGASWPLEALASEPGEIFSLEGPSTRYVLPGLEGCSTVPFSPAIHLGSTEHAASTPTGLQVDVHMPQRSTLQAGEVGESDLKDTSVTLPEGVQLSPSSANGLEACSEAQVGYEGPSVLDSFAPGAPAPLRFSSAPANCPEASKVGSVRVHTPLLEHELEGAVYLAEQDQNPFGSLLALYIVVEDPYSGVRVKLAGEVKLNETTGRITTTFLDAPQVPFEDFQLEFFAGPRASLSTPPLCGSYQTAASFTPWSAAGALQSASPDPQEEFNITSGPGGAPCADPLPFAPAFSAGAENLQAAAFTDFSLTIARPDQDQTLSAVSVTLPAGAAALLSSVTPCPEPQASQGTCGQESEIGRATAVSGLGPDPYTVPGGRVYITGPYQGAPFGLSIVTPAVAGPFNLGDVVVRASINVNPTSAQVTISSALPSIVQGVGQAPSGIPLALKQIHVTVDREHFEFNPTSCDPSAITGTLTGAEGASEPVASHFQVAGCESLPFAPKLTATAAGRGSKADGTSFDVTVASTGLGQANIAKVDLQLPKALSSRLSTLQQACTETVFYANPAGCGPGSVIGNATIHTPVLKNPLTGPAYLVSHGGAAFPDVEFVLQGEGITLLLDGKTDIKAGVTYSRFESAPDAPFTVFETALPAGPHGVLTPNVPEREEYSLCKANLQMPTEITGQNGAVINQSTNIAVTGCAGVRGSKTVKLTKAQMLARALAVCRRRDKHARSRRAACERQARRRYAAKKAARKSNAHDRAAHKR